jgi:hypothetical protein
LDVVLDGRQTRATIYCDIGDGAGPVIVVIASVIPPSENETPSIRNWLEKQDGDLGRMLLDDPLIKGPPANFCSTPGTGLGGGVADNDCLFCRLPA